MVVSLKYYSTSAFQYYKNFRRIDEASIFYLLIIEPRSEKTGLRGLRPDPTQTGLCSHRGWLEA